MKIDDAYIVKLFCTHNGAGPINSKLLKVFTSRSRPVVSLIQDKLIADYLAHRYNDSQSIRETIFRIKHKIDVRPCCKTPGCMNDVQFIGKEKAYYTQHCSCKCTQLDKAVRMKQAHTCIKLYGVDNAAKSTAIRAKAVTTLQKKYGKSITNSFQVEAVKQKIKHTMLSKYGANNITKTQYYKEKCKSIEHKTVQKRNCTKQLHGTFNTSKVEEIAYCMLVNKFGKDNITRQYTSVEYPFRCDFYVIPHKLYIEYNGSWTHGKHAFDANDRNDIKILDQWKSKHKKYYDIAAHTWTIRDVAKRNTAKNNKIYYKEFWKLEQLQNFLKGF